MSTFKSVLSLLLLSVLASVSAAEEPDQEPTSRIDYVDLNTRYIVINDWAYNLALDLKVQGVRGLETDFALKQGVVVKYELAPIPGPSETQTISTIWIQKN